jgi:hypothetical protein
MKTHSYLLLVLLLMTGCIGAGTHGKIKDYSFNYNNNELVSIVDQFLLSNPKYCDTILENGWVYIKIPPEDARFGFSIGGDSEIVLIAAGKANEIVRWDKDLGYFEERSLTKNFENNFLERLKGVKPKKATIGREPFTLTINNNIDTVLWPHYFFRYDTTVSYALPHEIDSLGVDYFENLILAFAKYSGQDIKVNQVWNLFNIGSRYCGYIKDSIYITTYYRDIGQIREFKPIFDLKSWEDYVTEENKHKRLLDYKELRESKVRQGYKETEVYSQYSEELWMVKNKYLRPEKNGS